MLQLSDLAFQDERSLKNLIMFIHFLLELFDPVCHDSG